MRIIYVSALIVLVDQASKLFVKGFSLPVFDIHLTGMYPGQSIQVLGDFFRITFIENPGMAFGFDPGIDFKLWLSIFSIIASLGLLIYIYFVREQKFTLKLALAFILGGAMGNLIDRMFYGIAYGYAPVFYGKVVDFLDFDFFSFTLFGRHYDRWPIFNIADASVTIGVLILLFFYKKDKNKKEEELQEESIREKFTENSNNEKSSLPQNQINNQDVNPDKKEPGNEQSDQREEIPL